MVILRFVKDPLLGGRLVSVLSGFMTVVGLWFVSWELFKNKTVSFVTSFLYVLIPFGLMYDRMALYDSLSASLSIWSLYFAILLVRRVRLDIALILGMVLGLGMLNKTSGFLSLYMLPGTLLLFNWSKRKLLYRWILFAFVAAFMSQLMYSVLRLSPLFAMIAKKDTVFVYSFSEWLQHPFNFLLGNIRGLFDWAIHYLTWPIFLASLLTGITIWKYPREKLLLLGWWFAPFFALALDGRVLYPRFILFMVLPLYILAAVGGVWVYERLKNSVWRFVLAGVLLFSSVYTDFYIITNPLYAPIPQADAGQYIDDWPSGWGVPQVNAFLTSKAQEGEVSIYTDGTFGLLPYGIEIYLVNNPNVHIQGLYPVPQSPPKEVLADAFDHPTYILFNQLQQIPPWHLSFIAQYQKGKREDVFMRLFQVQPVASESGIKKQ